MTGLRGAASASSSVPEVAPSAAQALLEGGALALDVREPHEYAEGHVAGAVLVPLGQLVGKLGELPHSQTIVVVRRSGRRSSEAVRMLQAAGFSGALNLAGGTIAWREAGLPIEV